MLDTIFDNRQERKLGEALQQALQVGGVHARFVSAFFSIYGFFSLRGELENLASLKFLFGLPEQIGDIDPSAMQEKVFKLTEDGLSLQQVLVQKHIAVACEKWVRQEKIKIRTIKKSRFMHGKMYHVTPPQGEATAFAGSSNFTQRGLGFSQNSNLELNLQVGKQTCGELRSWFDNLWNDRKLVEDAKQRVLDALTHLGKDHPPQLIYYKTLLEIFRDRIEDRADTDLQMEKVHFYDSQIWKRLYQFQQDAVKAIINRLKTHNGCILADSVGLGKTYTALGVIKFFENRNERVLVLCPKRISNNWMLYPATFNRESNPFLEDRFSFSVLSHTDLSRHSGKSSGIDLADFKWGSFDLVVIDESHNFRNDNASLRDDDGNIVRRSRYDRLLEEVIKQGAKTKVLMLSATPVNTTLLDLRNQIYLMTEKRQNTFRESLNIGNVQTIMNQAQKQFKHWEKGNGNKNKDELLELLGGDFFRLLDAVSIARSRSLIKKYYPKAIKKIGGFPNRAKPQNEYPPTDSKNKLSYQQLHDLINEFRLSVYQPSAYLLLDSPARKRLEREKKQKRFNQRDRENSLVGMIRVNCLKRLESSANSLELTLDRMVGNIDDKLSRIEKYQKKPARDDEINVSDYEEENRDEAEGDDELIVGKARYPIYFRDLDLKAWLEDLWKDRDKLSEAHKLVAEIKPERDAKLARLKECLLKILQNPRTDRTGRKIRKALVFTAFKDTAVYLYKELENFAEAHNAAMAMVAGDLTIRKHGKKEFDEIVTDFAPMGRGCSRHDQGNDPLPDEKQEIDILIATDCLSEGQNLQDCDTVINYDIHWNPVRLIQRFGRIDRIGSRNRRVRMINFWPTEDLDAYLDLKNRVEARMVLADVAATGDENHLSADAKNKLRKDLKSELYSRDKQLLRLKEEILDLEELGEDSVSLTDFTLDDFFAQLLQFLDKGKRKELDEMLNGAYALVAANKEVSDSAPGAIFLLKQINSMNKAIKSHNPLQPFYLGYVRDGEYVYYPFTQPKRILNLFSALAQGEEKPLNGLCSAFDRETKNGQKMEKYNGLIQALVNDTCRRFKRSDLGSLARDRAARLIPQKHRPNNAESFDLITWLVIKEK